MVQTLIYPQLFAERLLSAATVPAPVCEILAVIREVIAALGYTWAGLLIQIGVVVEGLSEGEECTPRPGGK